MMLCLMRHDSLAQFHCVFGLFTTLNLMPFSHPWWWYYGLLCSFLLVEQSHLYCCYCHPKFKTKHSHYHYYHWTKLKLKPPLLWLPATLCCFSSIMVPSSTLGLLLGSSACNWNNQPIFLSSYGIDSMDTFIPTTNLNAGCQQQFLQL